MSDNSSPSKSTLLSRSSWRETSYVADLLRTETVGGVLLLVAAVAALIWANSPWREAYSTVRDTVVGPASLHLDLTLGTWAADGLLAIFFLVAGIELKRELVAGDLRDRRKAALPIAAASAAWSCPPAFVVTVLRSPRRRQRRRRRMLRGWAVPTATDIAFALAVLAVIGTPCRARCAPSCSPSPSSTTSSRSLIIAVFFTETQLPVALAAVVAWRSASSAAAGCESAAACVPPSLALGTDVQQRHPRHRRRRRAGPDAALHREAEDDDRTPPASRSSTDPARCRPASPCRCSRCSPPGSPSPAAARRGVHRPGDPRRRRRPGRRQDHRHLRRHLAGGPLHPGRAQRGPRLAGRLRPSVARRHRLHRLAAHRRTRLRERPERDDHVKAAVLVGSLIAALLAAVVLRSRNLHYRDVHARETEDRDLDGIPDIYGPELTTPDAPARPRDAPAHHAPRHTTTLAPTVRVWVSAAQ